MEDFEKHILFYALAELIEAEKRRATDSDKYGELDRLIARCDELACRYEKSGEQRNTLEWVDNIDSWICPVCDFEVSSPSRFPECRCPRCGFQAERDKR